MKAARAEARAKREAEKAERLRRVELMAEIRRMSLEAVKLTIRDRGDKVSLYTHAQLRAMADAMIGPWLVVQAKARKPHLTRTSVAQKSCTQVRLLTGAHHK
jgi:hypothetical protein